MFLSGIKGLLHTTGVEIPAYIFRITQWPPLGSTKGAREEVHCVTDICQ
jgi:hypothetical protein